MESALNSLQGIHDTLVANFLKSEKNLDDEAKAKIRSEFKGKCFETESYSFSVTTKGFPQPLRASFVLRRMTEVLSSFIPDRLLLSDICIAIDEVVSNILDHSYRGLKTEAIIVFRFTLYRRKIIIEIEDFGERGKNFDFSQAGQYASREDLIRKAKETGHGMGVHLIRKIMDHVEYQVIPGECNKIIMMKMYQ